MGCDLDSRGGNPGDQPDWQRAFDNKTGWAVDSLIAGAITTYLLTGMQQAAEDSGKPSPGQVYGIP